MKIFLLLLPLILINCAHASIPLEQKLNKQYELYDQARSALLTQVQKTSLPPAQRVISRADWENMITLKGEWAIDAKDIAELKKSQQERINQSYQKALHDSVIDLDKIRKKHQSVNFCADLPKGGMLHIHDSGTLNRQTVHNLVTRKNPQLKIPDLLNKFNAPNSGSILYSDEKSWLEQRANNSTYSALPNIDQAQYKDFFTLPYGKHPFPRFEAVFSFISLVANDVPTYEEILWDFAQRASREKVIYAELREAVYPAFAPILQKIEKDLGVMIRVNRAYFRIMSIEDLDKKAQELLAEKQQPWVVGIDILANEDGNPAFEKGQLLYGSVLQANLAGKSTLHRTMHAGEIGDVRNPRDAMIMGAERLGHGVLLVQDPVALEYASRLRMPVEINLSSNLQLTYVPSVASHPYLNYLRLGLPVSLSTDDEGIFDTDINRECELTITQSNVTYAELKQMSINSIETSFASASDKKLLRAKLDKSFAQFEAKWVK